MVHGKKSFLPKLFHVWSGSTVSSHPPTPAAFPCHENGATVLQYAPKQQLLITGGRKGFVCVFDIRQRQLLHTFQAHDSAVKALTLDPYEDFFITGSAEGNMKVTLDHFNGQTMFIFDPVFKTNLIFPNANEQFTPDCLSVFLATGVETGRPRADALF